MTRRSRHPPPRPRTADGAPSRRSAAREAIRLLGVAALRAGGPALGLLRDGRCVACNARWGRLARRGGWRQLAPSPDGGASGEETLEAAALTGASELVAARRARSVGRYERDGGTVVELHLERARLGPVRGAVLAWMCDVTEQVRAERALASERAAAEGRERVRAVGELASGVAHDLNNTLHALRLRLSGPAACASRCRDHADDLREAERIATDAAARVRRLQDVARSREDVPDERVDVRDVVGEAVARVRREVDAADAAPVTFEMGLPPLPKVAGSREELGHVFASVLQNAREAVPAGGRVVVTGRRADDAAVEIAVRDDGSGIPADQLERVFEPLFTTRGRRGAGLGLAMAAGVMRRLGGSIRAANRPEGGAELTLRFPPAPRDPAPARAARGVRRASRRVLVVDDDPDNLDAMRLVLAERGHRVEATASGLDAVARVEGGARYDAIFCDLGLGDTSGWDVAARIAALAPRTRFLLVTGWAEEIPPGDPRRRHVAQVLAKPVALEDLEGALRAPSRREPSSPGARARRPPVPGAGPDASGPDARGA